MSDLKLWQKIVNAWRFVFCDHVMLYLVYTDWGDKRINHEVFGTACLGVCASCGRVVRITYENYEVEDRRYTCLFSEEYNRKRNK